MDTKPVATWKLPGKTNEATYFSLEKLSLLDTNSERLNLSGNCRVGRLALLEINPEF